MPKIDSLMMPTSQKQGHTIKVLLCTCWLVWLVHMLVGWYANVTHFLQQVHCNFRTLCRVGRQSLMTRQCLLIVRSVGQRYCLVYDGVYSEPVCTQATICVCENHLLHLCLPWIWHGFHLYFHVHIWDVAITNVP